MDIIVLEELRTWIPSPSKEEKDGLEADILRDGCQDALIVWNNGQELILVDGHNRYDICTRHGISYRTTEMTFEDLEEVKNWMIYRQINKRNLPEKKRDYLLGKIFTREKEDIGNKISNLKQFKSSEEETPETEKKERTSEKIAKEHNLSKNTIERAEKFSQGVDIVLNTASKEEQEGLKENILGGGDINVPKDVFQDLAKIKDEKVKEEIAVDIKEAIQTGDKKAISSVKDKIANSSGKSGIAKKPSTSKSKNSGDIEGLTIDATINALDNKNSKKGKEKEDNVYYEPKTKEEQELAALQNAIIENVNNITSSRHLLAMFMLSAIKPQVSNKTIAETDYKRYLAAAQDFHESIKDGLDFNLDAKKYVQKQKEEKVPFLKEYESEEQENFDFDETIRKRFKM